VSVVVRCGEGEHQLMLQGDGVCAFTEGLKVACKLTGLPEPRRVEEATS